MKSQEVKDANTAVVEKAISSIQESEVSAIIDQLDLDSCDVLMKYLYRLMSKNSNCAIVLKIHSVLHDRAGVGSIVRVLTDRKTL